MIKNATNQNKTIKWLLYLGIVLFALMTIVMLINFISTSSSVSKQLEDFSINSLSTEDIINNETSSVIASSRRYESNTRTGVDGASKYEDSDLVGFKCKKITGIKRISATKVSDCTLILNISSTLLSGTAQIVIICDDEILDYVEFGQTEMFTYDVVGEHIYSVKILAEEAELEIAVEREIN